LKTTVLGTWNALFYQCGECPCLLATILANAKLLLDIAVWGLVKPTNYCLNRVLRYLKTMTARLQGLWIMFKAYLRGEVVHRETISVLIIPAQPNLSYFNLFINIINLTSILLAKWLENQNGQKLGLTNGSNLCGSKMIWLWTFF
jgi:hypothetical protein